MFVRSSANLTCLREEIVFMAMLKRFLLAILFLHIAASKEERHILNLRCYRLVSLFNGYWVTGPVDEEADDEPAARQPGIYIF